MNKRQKELLQHQLDSEQAILKELEQQYRRALDDIIRNVRILQSDELTQSKVYQLQYQQALKGTIEAAIEKLHSGEFTTIQQYLEACYTNGFVGTMYDLAGQGIPMILPIDQKTMIRAIQTDSKINTTLYEALGIDTKKLKRTIRQEITRGLAEGMATSAIARNISNASGAPLYNAKRIARTEGHRVLCSAQYDAQQESISHGADVVKQWDSTLDGNTRPTHRQLDGQIREVDEPFEAGGKKAMYPGAFGEASEDCNCRCSSLSRARSALDERELETLKERAEYFGLDKIEDFETFKKKYLKAADESDADMISAASKRRLKNKYDDITRRRPPVSLAEIDSEFKDAIDDVIANAPEEFRTLIERNKSKIKFAKTNAIGNGRSTRYGIFVNLAKDSDDIRGAWTTTFHEIGHEIDKIYRFTSTNKQLSSLLKNDLDSFVNTYMRRYNMTVQEAYESIRYALLHGEPQQTHIISDLVGGLTGNKCVGKYGHDVEYWNRSDTLEHEAFAHFFGSAITGNPEEIDAIKHVFPSAYKEFMKLIRGAL